MPATVHDIVCTSQGREVIANIRLEEESHQAISSQIEQAKPVRANIVKTDKSKIRFVYSTPSSLIDIKPG